MRLSQLTNFGLILIGAATSLKTLERRREWERGNKRAYLVLDYDDAQQVCARAGLTLSKFLGLAREHGATHLSLPELTLRRLISEGRIGITFPLNTSAIELPTLVSDRSYPASNEWTCLTSSDLDLLNYLATELAVRAPASQVQLLTLPQPALPRRKARAAAASVPPVRILALQGSLPAWAEIGLGFDAHAASQILQTGLGLVPRPVAYSWPEDHTIERTLAQAAGLGGRIVAFEGDLVLGHEMHLEETLACMEAFELSFAFFCETRHQKGDWFLAKRLAGEGGVILSHYLSPQALIPEDYHSAAQRWGMLACNRGIRLCYINVFRHIHATEPLECLHYMEHVRDELTSTGLILCTDAEEVRRGIAAGGKTQLPASGRGTLAMTGLASAGAVSLALREALDLSESAALALTALSALGSAVLPFLDKPRSRLERAYPPSYAPKLLALSAAAATPVTALAMGGGPLKAILSAAGVQAAMGVTLAALTTGQEYQLRVEEYRSMNADLYLPLAALMHRGLANPRMRAAGLAVLAAAWLVTGKLTPDVLGEFDKDLPSDHTHHLSSARRLMGEAVRHLGPRPGRKWAGLGLAGTAMAAAAHRKEDTYLSLLFSSLATLGNALAVASFRIPQRPLDATFASVTRSWALWGVLGLAAGKLLESLSGDSG